MTRERSQGPSLFGVLALLFWSGIASVAHAQFDHWQLMQMDAAAFRLDTVAMMPVGRGGSIDMVYGDRYGHLRVVRLSDGSAVERWRSTPLEGPIYEVLVEDLEGDGSSEIIARTQQGSIHVYNDAFRELWSSQQSEYRDIEAMTIANVDEDDAFELILLVQGRIYYVDGATFQQEYQSLQAYRAVRMAVGNVDSDAELELVLNSGKVLDVKTTEEEWGPGVFGDFIQLLDIDGDGLQEILGWTSGREMRIFDVDSRQEKPLN
ncbi:MAG TPA: hypothetical protein VGB13_11420 [Candidatus Krumholzibacteria bacterium]